MAVHIWNFDGRLSSITAQVVEAQRLTSLAQAQVDNVRASLARSEFRVVGDLSTPMSRLSKNEKPDTE